MVNINRFNYYWMMKMKSYLYFNVVKKILFVTVIINGFYYCLMEEKKNYLYLKVVKEML